MILKSIRPRMLTMLLICLSVYSSFAQVEPDHKFSVIPEPVSMKSSKGVFVFPSTIIIERELNAPEVDWIANDLATLLTSATGKFVELKGLHGSHQAIHLLLNQNKDEEIGDEGYRLLVNHDKIEIKANKPAGLFHGVQTLLQLLPPEIENATPIYGVKWEIPAVEIVDYPRFGWRGMLFDVARHFFTKQEVKDFIDNMVKYKFNLLHLHLTDDQAWRLEIKSLPKLTEVGAWRAPREGPWGTFTKPTPDEPKTYGGFYTQDDIKEIIDYAAERFVNIMPEIDVPGHSLAAVAAYPELSATPGEYQVNSGERFMIWEKGVFYGTLDNTLNPANEQVYEFLDKVFTEVAALFPFEYIHMGGDECYKGFWEKSEACKQLMAREGLKDMNELQSYFVKRVAGIIKSKGKKMMGWDEILDGGLTPEASVMNWRGMDKGITATSLGHKVVMVPEKFAYLDLYQGDPVAEPLTYSMVRLNQAYSFNPLPDGIDSTLVLGGQANLWSERLTTKRHAEYMLWPRAFAIAESLWSLPHHKNWPIFIEKVERHFDRMDRSETKYSRSMYDPIFTGKKGADGKLEIHLATEIEGLEMYYSFDETLPDRFYPQYSLPLTIPNGAANLRVITYRDGKVLGKMITMPIAELKKRTGVI